MTKISRGLVAVIVGLLVSLVAVSGVVLAAGPSQPIVVGFDTISNISLNGVPGTQLVVAPGADVSITASYFDYHPNYCPGCIDYLEVAFQGSAHQAGCLENPGFTGSSGTTTVDLGPAPTTPGAYDIVAEYDLSYYCGQGYSANGGTAIAQIVILPTDKAQCKSDGWMNFGGLFKNQGDCVSYVATGGKNKPSGE